jgi:class 3 adenylate cyclase
MLTTVLGGLAATLALALALAWRREATARRRLSGALDNAASQLEHLQRAFHRFAPPDVVESIIQRGVHTSGERRQVTVLFADLVGFTALSEHTPPETVVRLLNGYFQAMANAIAEHNGYVSKFMGDGLLALFGAPEPDPWHALDAVEAALAMRAAMERYNAALATEGFPTLRLSVGVHSGPVVAGILGSADLVEYTVIGDVVNTAARIEALTRRLDADVLISGEVRAALDDRFALREMSPAEVKGKSEPIVTYAVDGRTPRPGPKA